MDRGEREEGGPVIHTLHPGPSTNRFQILIFDEELGDDMRFVRKDCCDNCKTAESADGCKILIGRCCPPGMTFKTSSCESCIPCVDFARKDFVRGDRTLGQPPPFRVDTMRQTPKARAKDRYSRGPRR